MRLLDSRPERDHWYAKTCDLKLTFAMIIDSWWLLILGGIFSGLLAGLLGIGGGVVLVPLIITLGDLAGTKIEPVQAVATSSLAIVMTAISGSIQNWRMGQLDLQRVIGIAVPALLTAQLGAYLADWLPSFFLLAAFGVLLIVNIFLANWRQRLIGKGEGGKGEKLNPTFARVFTGALAGLLAGLFGIGGGVIMVPLQMVLLGERIKVAIQTSLGVIVLTAISAFLGHLLHDNVLIVDGIILGVGGLVGAQFSTRFLPRLPEKFVKFSFYTLLAILSIYTFWQAWNDYQGQPNALLLLGLN